MARRPSWSVSFAAPPPEQLKRLLDEAEGGSSYQAADCSADSPSATPSEVSPLVCVDGTGGEAGDVSKRMSSKERLMQAVGVAAKKFAGGRVAPAKPASLPRKSARDPSVLELSTPPTQASDVLVDEATSIVATLEVSSTPASDSGSTASPECIGRQNALSLTSVSTSCTIGIDGSPPKEDPTSSGRPSADAEREPPAKVQVAQAGDGSRLVLDEQSEGETQSPHYFTDARRGAIQLLVPPPPPQKPLGLPSAGTRTPERNDLSGEEVKCPPKAKKKLRFGVIEAIREEEDDETMKVDDKKEEAVALTSSGDQAPAGDSGTDLGGDSDGSWDSLGLEGTSEFEVGKDVICLAKVYLRELESDNSQVVFELRPKQVCKVLAVGKYSRDLRVRVVGENGLQGWITYVDDMGTKLITVAQQDELHTVLSPGGEPVYSGIVRVRARRLPLSKGLNGHGMIKNLKRGQCCEVLTQGPWRQIRVHVLEGKKENSEGWEPLQGWISVVGEDGFPTIHQKDEDTSSESSYAGTTSDEIIEARPPPPPAQEALIPGSGTTASPSPLQTERAGSKTSAESAKVFTLGIGPSAYAAALGQARNSICSTSAGKTVVPLSDSPSKAVALGKMSQDSLDSIHSLDMVPLRVLVQGTVADLGLTTERRTLSQQVFVKDIVPRSFLASKGVRAGDEITEIAGVHPDELSLAEMVAALARRPLWINFRCYRTRDEAVALRSGEVTLHGDLRRTFVRLKKTQQDKSPSIALCAASKASKLLGNLKSTILSMTSSAPDWLDALRLGELGSPELVSKLNKELAIALSRRDKHRVNLLLDGAIAGKLLLLNDKRTKYATTLTRAAADVASELLEDGMSSDDLRVLKASIIAAKRLQAPATIMNAALFKLKAPPGSESTWVPEEKVATHLAGCEKPTNPDIVKAGFQRIFDRSSTGGKARMVVNSVIEVCNAGFVVDYFVRQDAIWRELKTSSEEFLTVPSIIEQEICASSEASNASGGGEKRATWVVPGLPLESAVNEVFLWRSANASAAKVAHSATASSSGGFVRATTRGGLFSFGLNVGGPSAVVYGRGVSLLEDCRRCDELVEPSEGTGDCAMCLCRATLGKIYYHADPALPNPRECEAKCTSGKYHSIFAERFTTIGATRGPFRSRAREITVFDEEQICVVYIITYRRGSPSTETE